MSTLKMTMTPEWEAAAILRTASKLTPDEFEAMAARVAKAIRAERLHDDLVWVLHRAHAIEKSVTQGQERDLRVGYADLLTAVLAKVEEIK